MKKTILTAALSLLGLGQMVAQSILTDTIWYKYTDRFIANDVVSTKGYDSIAFTPTGLKRYKTSATTGNVSSTTKTYPKSEGLYYFGTPERSLVKSSTYASCDFTKETSQFCFKRSMESEHFVIFWENGLTKTSTNNITYGGYTVNVKTMLNQAEKIWDVYVNELGFLTPGKSTTDKAKIEMFVVKASWDGSDWRADGSGTDGTYYEYSGTTKNTKSLKVGVFHCTPRAATARNGHTLAHEIGHTFQFLTGADTNGASGLNWGIGQGSDNEWWEDCANWQAYKVYPQYQYSDGEYYELYLNTHHLNIHHEDIRYNSCFYQDYWCQLHGKDAVARVWREAKASTHEDPVQAYMRIFGLTTKTFGDEMYQAFAHLTSMDIEGIHSNSQNKIGMEPQRLIEPTSEQYTKYLDGDKRYLIVDPKYCPENYGYNANPLKVPAAGTEVKVHFKGLAGADGYGKVKTGYAGWRYGLVAYTKNGTRVYSEMGSGKEGDVSLTIPEDCTHLWLVVMGAPTQYWSHSWTRGVDSSSFSGNGEQWPYAVKFEGTDALGVNRHYDEFPKDYARKDTTVVINASLAYSDANWSSVRVSLDMNAISEALGVSTAQLQAAVCGKKTKYPYVRIAGMNANGKTLSETKTISDTDVIFGHWFTTAGNVTTYGSSNAIFTKIYHDTYGCYVGQQPKALVKGKTYVVREAVIYAKSASEEYKAVMEIHLTVK